MTDSEFDPPAGSGIDTTVPHSARIWNYWLGGKDNYAVDREAGDAWIATRPEIVTIARVTRAFLGRAVTHLAAEVGIRQFLDVGTGLPTADNTHQIAQRIAPDARVVYVDNDPMVLAHAHALLTSAPTGTTHYLHADMNDTEALVTGAAETLDLTRPVGVFFMGVLGHIADTAQAHDLVQALMDRMPPGSYLTIADGTHPDQDPTLHETQEKYADTGAVPYWNRSREELAGFFDGLTWVEPGFVQVPRWRPDGADPSLSAADFPHLDHYGGMAHN